jgi:uncharacterized protein with gpF-like domain
VTSVGSNFTRPWGQRAILAVDTARVRERVARGRSAVRSIGLLASEYRRRLVEYLDQMSESVIRDISREYVRQDDKISLIAADAAAATELQEAIQRLRRRWETKFDNMSVELADYFATEVKKRSDAQLTRILRRGGISVKFKLTRAIQEVLRGIITDNVSLIRSIPQQYLTQVEGSVMRSVVAGGDLQSLVRDLRQNHGVARKRANLIARDQNHKATGAIARVRYIDLGIERAIWRHSHGGFEPRPSHLANDGQEYDVAEGWFDPDHQVRRYIRPGELINCRCFSQPVI